MMPSCYLSVSVGAAVISAFLFLLVIMDFLLFTPTKRGPAQNPLLHVPCSVSPPFHPSPWGEITALSEPTPTSDTMLGHSGSKDPTQMAPRACLGPFPRLPSQRQSMGLLCRPLGWLRAAVCGVVVRAWMCRILMVWGGAGVTRLGGRHHLPNTPSSSTDLWGLCHF